MAKRHIINDIESKGLSHERAYDKLHKGTIATDDAVEKAPTAQAVVDVVQLVADAGQVEQSSVVNDVVNDVINDAVVEDVTRFTAPQEVAPQPIIVPSEPVVTPLPLVVNEPNRPTVPKKGKKQNKVTVQ